MPRKYVSAMGCCNALVAAVVFQLLSAAPALAIQPPRQQDQLLVEHNSRILIKEKDKPEIHLLSIVADQILFSSRAYVHAWKFNGIDEVAAYLSAQDKAGVLAPNEIDLKRCQFFTVNTADKFAFSGRVYQWHPGNVNASWLFVVDSQRFEVLNFKEMTQDFLPVHNDFELWREFIARHNPEVYRNSWTEFKNK